jgi:hypothetical protein
LLTKPTFIARVLSWSAEAADERTPMMTIHPAPL